MIRTLMLVCVLAACGGKKPAPATTTTTQEHEHDEAGSADPKGGRHEPPRDEMPAEMTTFHDLLAPLWHAEKGPKRMQDTCAAIPQFRTAGDALAKATPPTKANADTWTTNTRALVASINELETACKGKDIKKQETAFHKLHESFHALMGAAGMEHKEDKGAHKHEH